MTIVNGTERDGVAILTTTDEKTISSTFVRAGDSFVMSQIGDGIYRLYFSTGEVWDDNIARFTENERYQRFEDLFSFTTGALTYTTWRVTLHGVVGGTAQAENVNPSEFPSAK